MGSIQAALSQTSWLNNRLADGGIILVGAISLPSVFCTHFMLRRDRRAALLSCDKCTSFRRLSRR